MTHRWKVGDLINLTVKNLGYGKNRAISVMVISNLSSTSSKWYDGGPNELYYNLLVTVENEDCPRIWLASEDWLIGHETK